MSIHEKLASLVGDWQCTNKLNLGESGQGLPIRESPCTASVSSRVGSQCLEIAYNWEFEGKPQEGLIVLDGSSSGNDMAAAWTDTFHYSNSLMLCRGTYDENGCVAVTGSYSASEGPDWHWRTEITPGEDAFKYMMINISPDGQEEWAVEMDFTRK